MIFKCQSGYTLRQIENDFYLLPYGQQIADQKKGLLLNETSVFLWRNLQERGNATAEQLAAALTSYYQIPDASFSSVVTDVSDWIHQLCQLGMLTASLQSVPEDASCCLSIAGLILHLYDPSDLVSASFDAFRTDSFAQLPDQRIDLLTAPPESRSYEQVLLQNREMTIFQNSDRYVILFPTMPDIYEAHMTLDGSYVRIFCQAVHTGEASDDLFHAIRLFFLYLAQRKGMFALHSASILYRNKAWLFSGHSGMGKSTHTALWHQLFQTPYLNGDLNLIGSQNGSLCVYGIPWCGTSGIYTTRQYPLGGIILLGRHPDQDVMDELSTQEKILRVMQRMISPAWTAELLDQNLSFASKTADKVPVFHLSCTMRPSAAQTAREAIDRLEDLS